ncbi:MAG: flagellar basal body L-ring protein FlgH [Deltaproteobacteria bacterium]|nr:flagellar basal body L-ring protein FlgH [Deltaproteobacteria bacterium]
MNTARLFLSLSLLLSSCAYNRAPAERIVPAEEFAKAMHSGSASDFSIFKVSNREAAPTALLEKARFNLDSSSLQPPPPPLPPASTLPPGSSSPYHNGQMRANPSLWPDEGQATSLFRDFRAYQPMDIITILIKESQEGKKLAETETEGKFSLAAGIKELFGLETKHWTANNTSLDPEELINATTDIKFEGDGETKRSGTLSGTVSAVIMEVLPNGLLRIEGTKIISVNSEEEILVISGLVRTQDVNANNQVPSNKIANMRIDFYGRGIVTEQQKPGWGARIFEFVWPF